jgi:uncharacterized membrane protein YqhA
MKNSPIKKVLELSRYMLMIAVIGSFLAATVLSFLAGGKIGLLIWNTITQPDFSRTEVKNLALSFIETVDLFLIGTVFYLISLGLFELFIDNTLKLPSWLVIHDLDELKEMLVRIVILVLGVLFLGHIITWDGETDILSLGVSIALVIAALSFFLGQKKKEKPGSPTK